MKKYRTNAEESILTSKVKTAPFSVLSHDFSYVRTLVTFVKKVSVCDSIYSHEYKYPVWLNQNPHETNIKRLLR